MKNSLLIGLCILLVLISLMIGSSIGEFGGADGQIEVKVAEIDQEYSPWFDNIWTPPSGEIESMLFSLQAAIGAGFIGYYIGRKQNVRNHNSIRKDE